MKRFNGRKGIIILVVLVCLIIGYYFYLSNKELPKKEDTGGLTAVQEVLTRNLAENYPATPKEVVKYFGEITTCFYNEEYTEDELKELAFKIRELYDTELASNQTDEVYLNNLKYDIERFKKDSYTISSFATAASTDVDYYTADGYDFAKINCVFTLRQGKAVSPTNERFLLRKDDNGHWKIYGWDLADTGKDEVG